MLRNAFLMLFLGLCQLFGFAVAAEKSHKSQQKTFNDIVMKQGDRFDQSMSYGDVNGDDFDDLIIGAVPIVLNDFVDVAGGPANVVMLFSDETLPAGVDLSADPDTNITTLAADNPVAPGTVINIGVTVLGTAGELDTASDSISVAVGP